MAKERTEEQKKYIRDNLQLEKFENAVSKVLGGPVQVTLDENVYSRLPLDSDGGISGEDFSIEKLYNETFVKLFEDLVKEFTAPKTLAKISKIHLTAAPPGAHQLEWAYNAPSKTLSVRIEFYSVYWDAGQPRTYQKMFSTVYNLLGFAKEGIMDGTNKQGLLPLTTPALGELRTLLGKPTLEAFFDWNIVKHRHFKFPCVAREFREGIASEAWLDACLDICKKSAKAREVMSSVTKIIIQYEMDDMVIKRKKSWNFCRKEANLIDLIYEMDYSNFEGSIDDVDAHYLAFAQCLDKEIYDQMLAAMSSGGGGGGGGSSHSSSGGGGGSSKSSGGGMRKCPHCGGKGVMGMPKKTCSPCGGSGQLKA